jgi:hypothetical protein
MMKLAVFSIAVLGASVMTLAVLTPARAADTTVSGTLVDVAKWVSGESGTVTLNMPDVMMSSMMSGMMSNMMAGSMSGMTANADGTMPSSNSSSTMSAHHPTGTVPSQGSPMGMGMAGGMTACHATLGVVTSSGDLYVLLANQASPMGALALCGRIGQQVSVTGTTYSRGGIRALLVSKLPK